MQWQDGLNTVPFMVGGADRAWPSSAPCPNFKAAQALAKQAAPAEPLVERAYARLRYSLIVGQVTPGQRITLGALAEQLGTSLTPVRDALSRLAAADALQHSREVGVIVPVLTRGELDELLRLRLAVEGMAFTNAVHRKADWRGFKLLHADLCRVAEGDDRVRFAGAVWALRVAILGVAGSSMQSMFVDRIWCRLGPTFTQSLANGESRRRLAFLFGEIVNAIGRHDRAQAHAAVVAEIKAGFVSHSAVPADELRTTPFVPGPAAAGRTAQGHARSGADHV